MKAWGGAVFPVVVNDMAVVRALAIARCEKQGSSRELANTRRKLVRERGERARRMRAVNRFTTDVRRGFQRDSVTNFLVSMMMLGAFLWTIRGPFNVELHICQAATSKSTSVVKPERRPLPSPFTNPP
jgi:hypothetical protein